jgi:hypothetical protein
VEVDGNIDEAIKAACIAGTCWRAAKFDRVSAAVWRDIARRHHERATGLLNAYAGRQGVASPPPD